MTGRLIAIASERPQVGKSTLAGLLEENLSGVRCSFAGDLREALSYMFPKVDRHWLKTLMTSSAKDMPDAAFSCSNLAHGGYRLWLSQAGEDMTASRSLRWHLLMYGTKYVRGHLGDTNRWRDSLLTSATEARLSGKDVIVDDLRFRNELEAVVEFGGHVIFLTSDLEGVGTGGVGEGRITIEDAHYSVTNWKGNPEAMLYQLRSQGFKLNDIK